LDNYFFPSLSRGSIFRVAFKFCSSRIKIFKRVDQGGPGAETDELRRENIILGVEKTGGILEAGRDLSRA
jgi:hypothetical protein